MKKTLLLFAAVLFGVANAFAQGETTSQSVGAHYYFGETKTAVFKNNVLQKDAKNDDIIFGYWSYSSEYEGICYVDDGSLIGLEHPVETCGFMYILLPGDVTSVEMFLAKGPSGDSS